MPASDKQTPHVLRRGFTLVELLVVVGIIAVLIAILLPSLQRARAAANALTCLSQMRQIGTAVCMYNSEYKGIYPIPPNGGFAQVVICDFMYTSPPTSYGAVTVFRCPTAFENEWGSPPFGIRINTTFNGNTFTFINSYSINEGTFHWRSTTPPQPTVTKFGTIKRASEIIYAVDGRGAFRIDNNDPTEWADYAINTKGHTFYRHGSQRPDGWFTDFNALYIDGHAEGGLRSIATTDVKFR